jgi:hypothetical protein
MKSGLIVSRLPVARPDALPGAEDSEHWQRSISVVFDLVNMDRILQFADLIRDALKSKIHFGAQLVFGVRYSVVGVDHRSDGKTDSQNKGQNLYVSQW